MPQSLQFDFSEPFTEPAPGIGNLDLAAIRAEVIREEDDTLRRRIAHHLAQESLELPQLPATALRIVQLTSDPSLELDDLVATMEEDPVLCGELLKLAGSPLYGSRFELASIADAVRRVGIKGVRSMVFALSMRGVIFRDPELTRYAEEVWRQAASIAAIGRALAPLFDMDPDRAFLVCLLSDIGKVAMMDILSKELQADASLRAKVHTGLVGDAFYNNHEKVGGKLAESWQLTPDIVAIAECHHRFYDNSYDARQAAFVSFVHKLDYHLSAGDKGEFLVLHDAAELDFMRVQTEMRAKILSAALQAFKAD